MHIFQKHILDQLRSQTTARYSELKPDDVESSHFKYHLDQHIKDGLVERTGRGIYGLSLKGKAAVDRLSAGTVNPKLTPKVITYTLIRHNNRYYLQKKDKEPYRGLLNMVGGKVHLGETTHQAALREIREKTALTLDHVSLGAIAEILIKSNETLISHVVAYVYVAELKEEPRGLTSLDYAALKAHTELAPDTLDIIDRLNTKAPAVLSIVKTI